MNNETIGPRNGIVSGTAKMGKTVMTTWQMQLIGVLVFAMVATGAVAVRYIATRQPIQSSLPAFPNLTFSNPPHFQYSIYGVNSPLGVAVSPDAERIYAVEGDGARETVIFDRSGKEMGRMAPPDSDPSARTPVYVAAGTDRIYVTDRLRHAIDVYDRDGSYLGVVPPPPGEEMWSPLGVGLDSAGNLLVTDVTKDQHRLIVLDQNGTQIMSVGREGKEQGQFSYPNGVAGDGQAHIYVADGNNGRIEVFDYNGNLEKVIGGGLGLPRGVALDSEQRLYMVDTAGHAVSVFDIREEPKNLYNFGEPGLEDGQFNFPNGIAVDGAGRIYVSDRVNQRLQVWLY